mgnify:CR=1 FL=1
MEMNLLQKKKRLRGKLPDIQTCLDMIEQLRKYKEKDSNMDTNFLLAHNLYGKATIPPTDKVRTTEFRLINLFLLVFRFAYG